jgi:hypothetical protein
MVLCCYLRASKVETMIGHFQQYVDTTGSYLLILLACLCYYFGTKIKAVWVDELLGEAYHAYP